MQQHVAPSRSGAPSIPASAGPSENRHMDMDEMFGHASHHDNDSLNNHSLLQLAGNLIQALNRPAGNPGHGL